MIISMSGYYKSTFLRFTVVVLTIYNFSCATPNSNITKIIDANMVSNAVSFDHLIMVDSIGVTGADGVISFPLNDSISVFMMGDSFLSPVVNHKRDVNSPMINNTFILINKNNNGHEALYSGTETNPDALLKPTYGNPKEYYWPGHGFEKNGTIHVFMSRFLHGDYDWGFQFSGTDYIRMRANDFKVISQEDFPFSNQNKVHYGHSMLNDGKHIYLYGAFTDRGISSLHVARATLSAGNHLEDFKFYNGKSWDTNPMTSTELPGVNQNVPEQFSVFKYKNKYVLILMARELGGGNIFSYVADSPIGPWKNEKLLYHTKEQNNVEDKVFTYNAMAHPQYITDDRLLVSYCVNSFDVSKIHEVDTDYYRPKFLWIPLNLILD